MAILSYQYGGNDEEARLNWEQKAQCVMYFWCFVFFFLTVNIFFSSFLIFLLSLVWLPQIYMNAQKNTRDTPNKVATIIMTIHTFIIPLYFMGFENFMFLQPNYFMFLVVIASLAVQIIIMFIQHKKPRFFLS